MKKRSLKLNTNHRDILHFQYDQSHESAWEQMEPFKKYLCSFALQPLGYPSSSDELRFPISKSLCTFEKCSSSSEAATVASALMWVGEKAVSSHLSAFTAPWRLTLSRCLLNWDWSQQQEPHVPHTLQQKKKKKNTSQLSDSCTGEAPYAEKQPFFMAIETVWCDHKGYLFGPPTTTLPWHGGQGGGVSDVRKWYIMQDVPNTWFRYFSSSGAQTCSVTVDKYLISSGVSDSNFLSKSKVSQVPPPLSFFASTTWWLNNNCQT